MYVYLQLSVGRVLSCHSIAAFQKMGHVHCLLFMIQWDSQMTVEMLDHTKRPSIDTSCFLPESSLVLSIMYSVEAFKPLVAMSYLG